jgi:hypothetical protein
MNTCCTNLESIKSDTEGSMGPEQALSHWNKRQKPFCIAIKALENAQNHHSSPQEI